MGHRHLHPRLHSRQAHLPARHQPQPTSATLNATVDPNGGANVTECEFEYGTSTPMETKLSVPPTQPQARRDLTSPNPTEVHTELSGLTTDTTYHYRVIVHNAKGVPRGADQIYTPHHVLGLTTESRDRT